jgi:putative spermidine/putrescine transport system substrate-binding protein
LSGDHTIGFQDATLATEAAGVMRFRDKGKMTRPEIDRLAKVLIRLKRAGQFRGFWDDYQRGVDLMASNEVVVESMWSPMVSQLQAQRFPVRYAAPPEGYRGWSGGLAISSAIKDPARLQAAYDYINWWHSGYAGAVMMRQGYYTAVQAPSRRFVDAAEWDFWIEGRPAARNLPGPFGDISIRRGQVRDGGSFARRASRYAVWNTLQREHIYQGDRWQEFRTA